MKTDFLTATFGGESDFYICSQNWNKKYSFHVCNQLNRFEYILIRVQQSQ